MFEPSCEIVKCFRTAGILDHDFEVVRQHTLTEDPFCEEDNDCDPELEELIQQTNIPESCSVANFVSADDDIPTCFDMDNPNWEENFLAELNPSSKKPHTSGEDLNNNDDEEEEASEASVLPPLKITSYTQALSSLEDVRVFLDRKGHTTEATDIMEFTSKLTYLHCKHLSVSTRQTSLMEFVTLALALTQHYNL